MQSDQLSPIGADMTSASSLSLSMYNLLLYDPNPYLVGDTLEIGVGEDLEPGLGNSMARPVH